jgi:hypothetical protein
MKLVNTQVIVSLASIDLTAAAAAYGAAMPTDIGEEYARQIAERNTEVKKAAVAEIINLIDNKDEFIVSNQVQINALQAQIDNLKSLQAKTQRAADYGMATRNYLPLLKIIGAVPCGTDKALTTVPDGWTAPAVPVAAA